MIIDPLIKYLETYIPLDAGEKQLITERFMPQQFRKRTKLLQEGTVCKQYTFIVEGCFRMYGVDDKGYEHNIQFAAENDWIADISSFHRQKNSALNIQALENSAVVQIARDDLYYLYLNILKLDRIFKVIIENKYVELQTRLLQSFSSTAEER